MNTNRLPFHPRGQILQVREEALGQDSLEASPLKSCANPISGQYTNWSDYYHRLIFFPRGHNLQVREEALGLAQQGGFSFENVHRNRRIVEALAKDGVGPSALPRAKLTGTTICGWAFMLKLKFITHSVFFQASTASLRRRPRIEWVLVHCLAPSSLERPSAGEFHVEVEVF
jgi:hypothetical protein